MHAVPVYTVPYIQCRYVPINEKISAYQYFFTLLKLRELLVYVRYSLFRK
jgi:hypothetical protein